MRSTQTVCCVSIKMKDSGSLFFTIWILQQYKVGLRTSLRCVFLLTRSVLITLNHSSQYKLVNPTAPDHARCVPFYYYIIHTSLVLCKAIYLNHPCCSVKCFAASPRRQSHLKLYEDAHWRIKSLSLCVQQMAAPSCASSLPDLMSTGLFTEVLHPMTDRDVRRPRSRRVNGLIGGLLLTAALYVQTRCTS